MAGDKDRFARFGQGRFHGIAVGQGAVELLGQENGGGVGDLKLHGDDGGDALQH